MDPKRVLFMGLGASAICYYRCALPAMFLGADWLGVVPAPRDDKLDLRFDTGLVRGGTNLPNFDDYDVVVVQQPRGAAWLRTIRGWQDRGIKVVFEVDDYLHGIGKLKDHDYSNQFSPDEIKRLELTMRVCDGVICATPYIARRYRKFNPRTYVCENGVDLARYQLTRPKRPTVSIGWAGGTGHAKAAWPWFKYAVSPVMRENDHTCCITIGQNYADTIAKEFGERRAVSVPWTLVDQYPAAMTLLDVAIAPAGKGAFFQGKSDLRFLEAGALGIPLVADRDVYHSIEEGVTGFKVDQPVEAADRLRELVADEKLRLEIGENARAYVNDQRSMKKMAEGWRDALEQVIAG